MANKVGYIGILDGIKTDAKVHIDKHGYFSQSFDNHLNSIAIVSQSDKIAVLHSARWDTGSELTYIDAGKAEPLEPTPGETVGAIGVTGSCKIGGSFCVALELPGGIRLSNIDIGELDLDSLANCDAIIGMDIISKGKLTVDGKSKIFTFEV